MSAIPPTPTRVTRAQSKLLSPEPSSGPSSLLALAPGTPRFAAPPSPPTFSSLRKAKKVSTPTKLAELSLDKGKGKGPASVEAEEEEEEESDSSEEDESSSSEEEDSDDSSSDDDEEEEIEDEEAYLEGLLASAYSNAELKEASDAARRAGEEVILELESGKEV